MTIAEPPTKIEIEQPQIEEVPTEKKPSQIIREWPEEEWCSGVSRCESVLPSGRRVTQHCDADILLFVTGHYDLLHGNYLSPYQFLLEKFGIERSLVDELVQTNDSMGKDAGADLLEAHGF